MKNAIGAALLAVVAMVVTPLMAFASCADTQTPVTVPADPIQPVDGFGQLNTAAIPNQAWVPWLGKAGSLCPEIPASLLAAQIEQESSWDPTVTSGTIPGLQTGGAEGLAQFMPGTWPGYGQDDAGDGNVSPYNPIDAIMAQGRYMCELVKDIEKDPKFKGNDTVALALATYNAGPDAVQKYGGIPPFKETQAYVPQITQLAITKYSLPGTSAGGSLAPASPGSGLTVPVGSAGPINAAILAAAEAQIGLPYVYAGGTFTGPCCTDPIDGRGPGFDCSGLVRYAVYQGTDGKVQLPRVSRDQGRAGPNIDEVPTADVQPGDIVAFKFGDDNGDGPTDWTHVGIVSQVSNGVPTQMFNAPESGMNLGYADLTRPFFADAPHAFFRVHL